MIKALTKVGKNQALIIPAKMIIKYKLGKKVMIEETENGILIHAVHREKQSSFQKKLQKLRDTKEQWSKRMREDSNNPEIRAHYTNANNNLSDIEPEIAE